MDYISRGFKSVLGSGGSSENQPSGAETVERLCDRVSSSTLLEDRRDAVRALKSLSKKYKLEVGTMALEILINVLQTDRNDSEITGLALDTLCNIMSTEQTAQDDPVKDGQQPSDSELGVQFTEIFIKNTDNVTLLLGLLEEYDFHVRWPAVRLLTILLTNRRQGDKKSDNGRTSRQQDSYPLQQCILVSPMGVSRLMDLLSDSREIIRNEGLLLLIQLTKSNAAIQKIVAFENAFDRLLEIVSEEGLSDGGIVVEDCLMLMFNLLKSNISNQSFFREGSYIPRLIPFFEIQLEGEGEDKGWSTQKVSNLNLMLQIVRTLVSPDNPQQSKSSCQKVMHHSGLLRLLCNILMASGIPAEILTETINTVSEVIRGDQANQDYFSKVMAPSNPPRSAVVVLLLTMINEKQPFRLRLATLYCFESYLYKNEAGQGLIVSTLLPSTAEDVSNISAGQLLCAGLFSPDSLSNWCAAIALCHCLKDNVSQKEQLLRVQLATSVGNPPVSLLQQCTNLLSQVSVIQTRVGLLLFLCSWLYDCPLAVSHFLHNPSNIPHLIAQVQAHGEEEERLVEGLSALLLGVTLTFNDDSVENNKRTSLLEIIKKRIGVESLLDKTGYVSKSEYFTLAAKSPQIQISTTLDHVLFDFEFTKLFKKLEASITKAIETPESEPQVNGVDSKKTQGAAHDSIVASYKELIREQDGNLSKLKSRCQELESLYHQCQSQLHHHVQESHQLREQLHVLQSFQPNGAGGDPFGKAGSPDITLLQNQIKDLVQIRDGFQQEFIKKEEKIKSLEKDLEIAQASLAVASATATLAEEETDGSVMSSSHVIELEQLRQTCRAQHEEINSLKIQNTSLNQEIQSLRTQVASSGSSSETAKERDRLLANLADQQSTIKQLEESITQLSQERHELIVSNESLKKEHEDLLVLMTEQDEEVTNYKKQLKDLGVVVDDEDEDEEDEDEDDNDDGDSDDSEEEGNKDGATREEEEEKPVEEEKGEEESKQENEIAVEREDSQVEPEASVEAEEDEEDEDTEKRESDEQEDDTDEERQEFEQEEESTQEKGEIDQDQTEKSEELETNDNITQDENVSS